jgi:hypothetical protein
MSEVGAEGLLQRVQRLEEENAQVLQELGDLKHNSEQQLIRSWLAATAEGKLQEELAVVEAAAAEAQMQQACAQTALHGMAAELRAAVGVAGAVKVQAAVLEAELGVAYRDKALLQQKLAESRFSASITGAQLATVTAATTTLQQQLAQVQADHAVATASASHSAKAAAAILAAEQRNKALQQQLQRAEHRNYSNLRSATERDAEAAEARWVAVAIQRQLQDSIAAAQGNVAATIAALATELQEAQEEAEAQAVAAVQQAEKRQEKRRALLLASEAAWAGKHASEAAAVADAQQARAEMQAMQQQLSELQASVAAASSEKASLQQQLAEAHQQLATAHGQYAEGVAGLPVAGSSDPAVHAQFLQALAAKSQARQQQWQATHPPAGL